MSMIFEAIFPFLVVIVFWAVDYIHAQDEIGNVAEETIESQMKGVTFFKKYRSVGKFVSILKVYKKTQSVWLAILALAFVPVVGQMMVLVVLALFSIYQFHHVWHRDPGIRTWWMFTLPLVMSTFWIYLNYERVKAEFLDFLLKI